MDQWMDPAGDPSLQDFWNENCFPQREMKKLQSEINHLNNYAASAWVHTS